MSHRQQSSRARYRQFRNQLHAQEAVQAPSEGEDGSVRRGTRKTRSTRRSRKFTELFRAFWTMLRGHHRTMLLSLTTASIATLLGIAPLYGTKLVFDNVLGAQPLPESVPAWIKIPPNPEGLLGWIAVVMVGCAGPPILCRLRFCPKHRPARCLFDQQWRIG